MKRFRESGAISVQSQGRKPLLDAREHRALRRFCLRNCHATMMDIATGAREYFGISLSLNTIHCCINKCNLKLYFAKRKAFIHFEQKCHQVLWAPNHLSWTERQWKRVLWSDESTFQLVFGKNRHRFMCQIWKRPSRLLPTKSAKTRFCDGMGVHQWPQHGWSSYMWRYHWCGG